MTANCKINSPIDSDTNARQQHDPHTNHQLTTSFFARAPCRFGMRGGPWGSGCRCVVMRGDAHCHRKGRSARKFCPRIGFRGRPKPQSPREAQAGSPLLASRLPLTPVISASDLSKRRLRGSGGYKCSCKLWVEHLY